MAKPNLNNGLQFTDWQGTELNGGLFDDGSGYGINSASDDANGWVDNILDPTGFVKGFYNDMMGFTSQEREFEQQERITDKQNQWNSASAQMARAKAAGINPLTAAGGIAGNGQSSVAPAAGAATPSSALADTVQKVGSLGANNSLAYAQARDIQAKQDPSVQNILADTYKKYKEAGYTDIQAQGLAIANAFLPTEKFLGIVALNSNIDVLRGQYKNLMQDIDVKKARIHEINKHIDEMGAHLSLMEKQALTEEARKLQIDAETAEINWFNDKRQELGVDPKSPLENQLFMMGVTGNPNYEKGLQIVYDTQYNKSSGQRNAENTSDTLYGRIGSSADLVGRIAAMGTDLITGVVSDISNLFKGNLSSRDIRSELNGVLNNAYDQLDKYPNDAERLMPIINDIQSALQLSNKELKKWYDTNWK